MSKHTKGPWIKDDGGHDSPENMAACIQESAGTEREWVAVGIADADGYAESVAYCHPDNAALIAAAPDLLKALNTGLETLAMKPNEDGRVSPWNVTIAGFPTPTAQKLIDGLVLIFKAAKDKAEPKL